MRRCTHTLLAWAPLVIGGAWAACRSAAEFIPSVQILAWIPIEWAFLLSVVVLVCGLLLRVYSGPTGAWGRRLGLVSVAAMGLGVVFGSWNLQKVITGPGREREIQADDVQSIAFLNLSAKPNYSWADYPHQVDVAVLTNPMWGQDLEPAWDWIRAEEDERDALRFAQGVVLTRYRVVRHAVVWLDFEGLWPSGVDPERGWVACIELQQDRGDPLVLWVVDMPSSPRLPKRAAVRAMLESIRSWQGQFTARDAAGLPQVQHASGFPLPDVIVGDFNMPRWSSALDALEDPEVFSTQEVSRAAGTGPPGTFPSPWSILPIDLVFTAEGWIPVHHTAKALAGVRHRAVTAWFRPEHAAPPGR